MARSLYERSYVANPDIPYDECPREECIATSYILDFQWSGCPRSAKRGNIESNGLQPTHIA